MIEQSKHFSPYRSNSYPSKHKQTPDFVHTYSSSTSKTARNQLRAGVELQSCVVYTSGALNRLQGLFGFGRGRMCVVGFVYCSGAWHGAGSVSCTDGQGEKVLARCDGLEVSVPGKSRVQVSYCAVRPSSQRSVGHARPLGSKQRLWQLHLSEHCGAAQLSISRFGCSPFAGWQRNVLFCFTRIKTSSFQMLKKVPVSF